MATRTRHPSILEDGFADDTAPSTPYVSRRCVVARGWLGRLVLDLTRRLRALVSRP